MNQNSFDGFGPSDSGVADWRAPENQPLAIVALCKDHAHAVLLSLKYAEKRFGFLRRDVAERMEVSKSRPSEWCKPGNKIPKKHWKRFAHATGCNLLLQHIEDVEARRKASGQMTERERDDAIVEMMTRAPTQQAWAIERRKQA